MLRLALVATSGALACSVQVLLAADSAVARVPVVNRLRGTVLDTILGPAEDFEYVSRTAPSFPPPA